MSVNFIMPILHFVPPSLPPLSPNCSLYLFLFVSLSSPSVSSTSITLPLACFPTSSQPILSLFSLVKGHLIGVPS